MGKKAKPKIGFLEDIVMGEDEGQTAFLKDYAKNFKDSEEAAKAIELLQKAMNEKRMTGQISMLHNLSVAKTIMSIGLERNSVLAALLHNSLEVGITNQEIENLFGKKVLELIEQKHMFERALEYKTDSAIDRENARKKMFVVLTTNPTVVILQLSEMLDKTKHLEELGEEQKNEFATEIKELYSPLASKLGIYLISSEMNDAVFKLQQPEIYAKVQAALNVAMGKIGEGINRAQEALQKELENTGIEALIEGRIKTTYSTYLKVKKKNVGLNKIYDLMALRVITNSEKECYEVLGIVHSLWKPIPGEFDDYIAKAKENGYRSLHTSVYTSETVPLEVQIRTKEMNDFAEFGVASHWKYKGEKMDSRYDKKIEWIRQLIDWQKKSGDTMEIDLFGKEVFTMTPKGEVIELPHGATVLDFAYSVHTDLGDKCTGAKVNGALVSLHTQIKNGDVVEVVTNQKQNPKVSWLSLVKTTKAKQKIRSRLNIGLGFEATKKTQARFVQGITTEDRRVRLAKCCNPLPGDEIVGFRTTKRKVSVHRVDCPEIKKIGEQKALVGWGDKKGRYESELVVKATDRTGMLKDLLEIFSRNDVQVKATNARTGAMNNIECRFEVSVKNLPQLEEIFSKISAVKGVTSVYRE